MFLRCSPHCLTQDFSLSLGLANETTLADQGVQRDTPISTSSEPEPGLQVWLPHLGLFSQGWGINLWFSYLHLTD